MYFKKLGKQSGLETQDESSVHSEPIGNFHGRLYFGSKFAQAQRTLNK